MHGDQRARHISRLKLLTHACSLSSLSHDALYQPCLWVEEDVAVEAVQLPQLRLHALPSRRGRDELVFCDASVVVSVQGLEALLHICLRCRLVRAVQRRPLLVDADVAGVVRVNCIEDARMVCDTIQHRQRRAPEGTDRRLVLEGKLFVIGLVAFACLQVWRRTWRKQRRARRGHFVREAALREVGISIEHAAIQELQKSLLLVAIKVENDPICFFICIPFFS